MRPRSVEPEILDELAGNAPEAQRSRRDLQRIHRLMWTRTILRKALFAYGAAHHGQRPMRVLELGAGDGTLMLGFARLVHSQWPAVELTLLDRTDIVEPSTIAGYADLGWKMTRASTDVRAWAGEASAARDAGTGRWDLILANLFLHHFKDAELALLLKAIAKRTNGFFACEPRRSRLAALGSLLMGIGVNAVTRADAAVSVRAGFRDHELKSLWLPPEGRWAVREYPAGLFSHCFHARRDVHLIAGGSP
jgi:Methyltransferase domain